MSHTHRPACVLEALEPRLLLAVTAVVDVNGNLVITGDNAGNNIVVTRDGATYTVVGDSATTTHTATGELRITTGSGVDWVTLDNVTVGTVKTPSNVVLSLGDGLNVVGINGLACQDFSYTGLDGGSNLSFEEAVADSSLIRGSFAFNAGMGNDYATLRGTKVQGNVNFSPGRGTNTLSLQLHTLDVKGKYRPFVGGTLTYTGGLNDDHCDILAGAIGSLQANMGAGQNGVLLGAVSVGAGGKGDVHVDGDAGDDVFTSNGAYIGNLTLAQGNGANTASLDSGTARAGRVGTILVTGTGTTDGITIRGTAVAGDVTATMGDGANAFTTGTQGKFAVAIGGLLNYSGGAGADQVNMQEKLTIKNGLHISTGGGNDFIGLNDLTLSGTTGNAGNALFDLGAGDDYLNLDSFSARDVTIYGGEGTNSVMFTHGPTLAAGAVSGVLTITGGSGADESYLYGTKFAKDVNITPGAGNDRVLVSTTDQPTSIAGSFTFTGSDGDDLVQFTGGSSLKGLLTINGDADNDTVNLYNSTLKGEAQINLGAGSNSVVAHALTCGNLSLHAQAGNGQFTLADDGAGHPTLVKGNLIVDGDVGGVGVYLALTGSTVKGTVNMTPGNGSNTFHMAANGSLRSAIGGIATYTGGSGVDNFQLKGGTLSKDLNITAGAGANFFWLSDLSVKGNVSYQGGADADTVRIVGDNGSWAVGGDLSLTTQGGNDFVLINGASLPQAESVVAKRLVVSAGTGDDTVTVGLGALVKGNAILDLEAGADTLTFGIQAHFHGPVTVNGGDGIDTYNGAAAIFDLDGQPTVTNIP